MTSAEIITIGDELLIGQVIDTNSAWIGNKLSEAGIRVKQITSVSDDEQHILSALKEAAQRADLILLTGGLGPTKDDITKFTLCKYFKSNLYFDEEVFLNVERIFKSRGKLVTAINRKQAEVPEKCIVIHNELGTAPGMWFEKKEKIFISMPGVPYEMKEMMKDEILPKLKLLFAENVILHKTILTQGIGESNLSDMISEWESHLPENCKLAYLPSPGLVRLRLTITGTDELFLEKILNEELEKLKLLAGEFIFGYDEERLEKIVGELLRQKKATLSTAESCTGGYIAHRIASVPGSSDYYVGSVVAYSYQMKEVFLDVDKSVMEKRGAVSEEVVKEMAIGVRKKMSTDYSIAVSGIAGPDGGTDEKPVGTVWLGIATPENILTKKLQLGNGRERVVKETSLHALNMLRKILLGEI